MNGANLAGRQPPNHECPRGPTEPGLPHSPGKPGVSFQGTNIDVQFAVPLSWLIPIRVRPSGGDSGKTSPQGSVTSAD
jgi:hypothetical protein